jgi:transposase
MLIKTLLNECYPIKGFVYEDQVRLEGKIVVVSIHRRKNSKGLCSRCQEPSPGYDRLGARRFRFVPLWGYIVEFLYAPRRVQCPRHGIVVEALPWADGKSPITQPFKLFLAHWAKHLSWKGVSVQFQVSWRNVYDSVKHVVAYGLKHRELEGIRSLGVDEIQYARGHKYLTLVYQVDKFRRRLLFIGKDRRVKTLLRFFYRFGKERSQKIVAIFSDLWKPYLKVIKSKLPQALHILDRFHIMGYLNDAVDNTRRQETYQLRKDGYEPILEKSRWCLLKNKCNQTRSQLAKLKELVHYNLKTMRAYLLKEAFQHLWSYHTRWGAERFLKEWLTRAMRSRLPKIKKVAKSLRKHQHLLLNYFSLKERLSNGIVEGFNLKAKLTMRRSFGFRSFNALEVALYHTLGDLPEPQLAHRFC